MQKSHIIYPLLFIFTNVAVFFCSIADADDCKYQRLNYLKYEISEHNYNTFKKDKPTIAFILPIIENKLDVAEEMYNGFLCFKDSDLAKCFADLQSKSYKQSYEDIKNMPFNILIANDENDPTQSIYLAEKLVKNPSIITVVGHNSSINSIVASKTYEKHAIPIISPTADGTIISSSSIMQMLPSTDDTTDYFSRFIYNYYRNISKKCMEGDSEKCQKNLLMCHAHKFNPASASLSFYSQIKNKINELQKLDKKFTIELVEDDICILDTETETETETKDIIPTDSYKEKGINGVVAIDSSEHIEKYLKLLQNAGKERPIFISTAFLTKPALERYEGVELDLYTVSPFYNKAGYIPWRTAMVYDTFRALEAAYNGIVKGEKPVTPQEMREKLRSQDFVFTGGITGNVFFSRKRTHEDTYQNHKFDEIHDSKTGDLNPIVKIILKPHQPTGVGECSKKSEVTIQP
jgi:ABC-type branched-subunit amino acid transport system substrate-binding protein